MNSESDNQAIQAISTIASRLTGVQLNARHDEMIRSRIRKRCIDLDLPSLSAYVEYFKAHTELETPRLVSLITTHHTFFFREFQQFEFLGAKALPALLPDLKSRADKTLRVWSAACSRGQEAYSLAMYLDFHLRRLDPSLKFEIVGTDIDSESVEIAKNGVFLRAELKEAPLSLMGSHWARGTGDIANYVKAKASLRDRCKFSTLNLLDLKSGLPPHQKFDLVFCRNVFIYFNEQQVRQITGQLMERMGPSGYLFVGISESLLNYSIKLAGCGPAIYQHPKPANAKSVPPAKAERARTTLAEVKASVGPLRVLCVDDSPSIHSLLKKILSKESGFEIVGTALNGLEAIKKVAELKPDVLTLDIHMPEMNGIEYLEKNLRPGHPPVVMITSVSRENSDLAIRALNLGAADFVEKPALSNLTERGEEIKTKLRCAVTAQQLSAATSIDLDRSFQKASRIDDPDSKLRLIYFNLSSRKKLRSFFSELAGDQPPTILLLDGGKDAAFAAAGILAQDLSRAVTAIGDTPPTTLSKNSVYLADLATVSPLLTEIHTKSNSTSILVFGDIASSSATRLLAFSGAELVLEDLGSGKGARALMDAASDIVAATSFAYLSTQHLGKKAA